MKREKPTGLRSNDKNVKPSKKLKVRITSDDQSPSEAGQSKEANNTPVYPSGHVTRAKAGGETSEATKNISDDRSPSEAGQSKEANNAPVYPSGRVTRAKAGGKTSEATKSISNGKKTPGKQEKAAELRIPVIKSARKKGEISADNKGQKTLPEGAKGTLQRLQEAVTLLMNLSGENNPLNPEAETPQSFAPLSPETTGNQANADTTVRRETGRPDKIRRQAKLPETPLGVSNENGDAIPAAVDASKQKKTSSTVVVNGDKTLNRGSERELALQQDAYKTVKGKQGERRSISSLETEAPAQEFTMAQARQQLTADQLVPVADRVRIGATNHCWDPSTKCENQIMVEILKNHPIINALTTTTTIPTIYIHQLWHTITYNHLSKSLKCKIDQQEVDITLDFFRTVLRLPNKTDNEHTHFEPFPSQEELFGFLRELGYDEFEGQLRVPSQFRRKNLPQPWQTMLTILTRCTTGKETGRDIPRLLTLQMLHGVILLRHIDYARLIWQEFVEHVESKGGRGGNKNMFVPQVRFIKLIIHGLMNKYQSISARTDEPHHHDEFVTLLRDNAATTKKVAMDIPDALLNLADKETDTYKKYLKSRVPMDRSQPAVPSQGTHKKPSAKLRKESKAKKGKKTKDVPMDEDEEIDWDAAIDEGMEHVIMENIEGGEKDCFSENKGGTSMTSLGNEECNSEDNERMDDDGGDDDDDDGDDDVRSYRWVRRNEKKQTPNLTPRRSTRTTSREPGVTVSVHEQPPSPPPPFITKTTSIQKAPPKLKSTKHVPSRPTEPLIAPIPTPEPTTQELDEMSFVTVAQMKTVMSTAIAHVNEQIEKAVADHVNEQIEKAVADQFKKYLASQPTTSQPTTSSTPHPNTSGPQHNYKDFEFEELKQMMLAHMLDQPELRNAKPALFGYLYRGADLERTCTTNVLRKRLHDDPDSDNP